jgi:hypothetical protein
MLQRPGRILTADAAFHERKICYSFIMESSIIVFPKEKLFMFFKWNVQCIKVK